jgi:1-acyl-sn-glycerol-3-phosphate acyltransferase
MRVLRTLWRGLRLVEHLVTGALICVYISLAARVGLPRPWVPWVVCWWHGRLCRALGIRVQVSGAAAHGCLLVANHVSWLDAPVLGAQGRLGFLSKSEVRSWPLVGWMSAVAGTLFIERGANQAAAVSAQIAGAIAGGRTLVIFPEGTTSDGRQVRRFHPRLFAVARQPGLRVQPVAIGYRRGADPAPDLVVPFVGDDTLVANLWRILRHPDLVAQVRFLSPMELRDGEDRRRFAARARSAIVQALGLPAESPQDGDTPPGDP